jgi:hypothetical protein
MQALNILDHLSPSVPTKSLGLLSRFSDMFVPLRNLKYIFNFTELRAKFPCM